MDSEAYEQFYRRVTAQNAAHATLINTLLRFAFKDLDADGIKAVGDTMKELARNTDAYIGAHKGDEAASERLADLVVRMQTYHDAIVDNAVTAGIAAVERRR